MQKFHVNLEGFTAFHYRPAKLYANTAGYYIEYAVLGEDQIFHRTRVKLNRLKRQCVSVSEFHTRAESMVSTINSQLMSYYTGTPSQVFTYELPRVQYVAPPMPALPSAEKELIEQKPLKESIKEVIKEQVQSVLVPLEEEKKVKTSAPVQGKRAVTPITVMLENFIKEKSEEYKKSTLVSFKTFCNQISAWFETNYPKLQSGNVTHEMIVEYMEFVNNAGNSSGKKAFRKKIATDHVSPRTYNNNLKMGRAVFSWAVERCYMLNNPFDKIKKKREGEKRRTIIPAEDRTKMFKYFEQHNPAMCIVMQMVFTSLIRPIDISRVQVKDIDFINHCIHLPGDKTKTGASRDSRMDEQLERMLLEHTKYADMEDYLFSGRSWLCGSTSITPHAYSKAWLDMREALNFPEEYQLYSLRDTSINNMLLEGIPALDVMQAAGHSDLSMTTRYANHKNPNLIKKLNTHAPSMVIEDKK